MRCILIQFCKTNYIFFRLDLKKFINTGLQKPRISNDKSNIFIPEGFKSEDIKLLKRDTDLHPNKISVLLHKPYGYISTYSKNCPKLSTNLLIKENRFELDTPNKLEPFKLNNLVPLSPLEAKSTGLLIYSQDKSLCTKFNNCEEEFQVSFKDQLTDYKLSFLRGEIYLDGYPVGPLIVNDLGNNTATISFKGSSNKLRKICLLAGLEIKSLKRIRISNIRLGSLLPGEWRLLRSYEQHGWRFEKLRPTFKKWVRIDHPPQNRSTLIKLDEKYNKLMYVTNGKISPKKHEEFLKSAKHYVKKGDEIQTPVLAFAKGGSHELLETLSMDDVYQLEELIPDIHKAFEECEKLEKPKTSKHTSIKY